MNVPDCIRSSGKPRTRCLARIAASLRWLPAWRLLRTIRLDDETALARGRQRNPRLIDRRGEQSFHVGMCQLAGRLHLDESSLLSRSQQKPLRVGQLRSLIEVQRDTGGTCGDRHDGIDPSVRRRIADHERGAVVAWPNGRFRLNPFSTALFRAKGPPYSSLGHRPRQPGPHTRQGLKARLIFPPRSRPQMNRAVGPLHPSRRPSLGRWPRLV